MSTLRHLWAGGQPTIGSWLSAPTSITAEATARAGFDYVCADLQHGVLDYGDAVAIIQGILLGGSRPLVRVPRNELGIIGKLLDAGAEGVIVPMVNSAEEAAAAASACRYAPVGTRSYGPTVVGMRTADYVSIANDTVAMIAMIETVEALEHLDEILAVPGIDAVYVGPSDLSLSLGLPPANNDDRSEFADALAAVVAACRRTGVVPGIHTTAGLATKRLEQGFQLVTVSNELAAMRATLSADLAIARAAVRPDPS